MASRTIPMVVSSSNLSRIPRPAHAGHPFFVIPRLVRGICPPVSGQWSSKARSQEAASHPLLRSCRTAGLLTTTVLQPAARDSVATLLLWAEGGYEKPGKTCLPSLFQRRVATLFRTIFSHSEQSPLSFRAKSRNLSRHSTAPTVESDSRGVSNRLIGNN